MIEWFAMPPLPLTECELSQATIKYGDLFGKAIAIIDIDIS